MSGSVVERFWAKVEKHDDGCWLWTGRARNGYGHRRFWVDGHLVYAHRVAWELENGPIPEGAMVLHRCDVPECVRPDHLFLGDASANQRDSVAKGRHSAKRRPKEHDARLAPFRGPGEADGNAKLTSVLVREIRERYANGEGSLRSLAAEYGVHNSTVHRIVNGERWPTT